MKLFTQSITIINVYHCYYHYIGAYLNDNKAIIANKLNNQIEYETSTNRSKFLYNDGNIVEYFKQYINDSKLYEKNILDSNIHIFKNNSILQKINEANNLYKHNHLADYLKFYNQIVEILDKQHFYYHSICSLHYYYRGLCFEKLNEKCCILYDAKST